MNVISSLRAVALAAALALGVPAASGAEAPPAATADRWSYSTLPPAAATGADDVGAPASDNAAYLEKVYWDRKEERAFKLTALIALSCTMAVLYLIAAFMLFRLSDRARGQNIVHLTSLSLIVYGALALTLVPTTSESLTAPIGILGALAGYLFGHVTPKAEPPDKDEPASRT